MVNLGKEYHILGPKARKWATLVLGLIIAGGGTVWSLKVILVNGAYLTGVYGISSWGFLGILSVGVGVDLVHHQWVRRVLYLWVIMGLLASLSYWIFLFFDCSPNLFGVKDTTDRLWMVVIIFLYICMLGSLSIKSRQKDQKE